MESIARNKRIVLNIKLSGLMRVASIGINLLLVPFMLTFLGDTNYGLWLTISSFLGWSSLLDLGMGNGLKNRLAESLAHGRYEELRRYTSSAYTMIGLISLGAFLVFAGVTYFLDWNSILNAGTISDGKLQLMLLVFFLFFCMKLVLNQVVNIASSKQYTSMGDVVNLLINGSLLLLLFLFPSYTGDRLLLVVILFSAVPVLVLLGVSIWAFTGPYKRFRPSYKMLSLSKGKDIVGLGSRFFIIQIAGIVLFSTDNLIISHFIDPSAVAAYHISFRYFGIVVTFFSILCTPFWPAFTEAYQKGDFDWIKRTTSKLVKVWLLAVLIVVAMFMLSPKMYSLWVGDEVSISWGLSAMMALYVISLTWGTIFVTFINSTGKLQLQLISSVIAGLVNIPLSIFFIRYTDLGASGVMLATIICLSYGPVLSVIQYRKIVNKTAKGIWKN